jgi:hypothetical protein
MLKNDNFEDENKILKMTILKLERQLEETLAELNKYKEKTDFKNTLTYKLKTGKLS